MNLVRLLLIGSVALNLGFATLLILTRAITPGTSVRVATEAGPGPQNGTGSTSLLAQRGQATEDAATSRPRPRNYQRLFNSLRQTGIPAAEAAALVRAIALEDWLRESRHLSALHRGTHQFWRYRPLELDPDAELAFSRRLIEVRRELEGDLSEVLGEAQSLNPWNTVADNLPPGLPPERARAVVWLEEDYDLLMRDIFLRDPQGRGAIDEEALRMLEQERLQDLSRLLTPEELEYYELRTSALAQRLRDQLQGFAPSEEEFQTIFRAARAREIDPAGAPHSHDELRQVLGEERFEAYLMETDEDFQQLARLTDRLQLPAARALEVQRFANFAEEKQEQIHSDIDLDAEDRAEALRLLLEEGREIVLENLGPQGYELYLESGGWWLRDLELQLTETSQP
jgi:hypothetical protein